jgi:hypothetical protein
MGLNTRGNLRCKGAIKLGFDVVRAGVQGELAPMEGFLPCEGNLDGSGGLSLRSEVNLANADDLIVGVG